MDYKALGEAIGAIIGLFVAVCVVLCFILAPIAFVGMLLHHLAETAFIASVF